MSKAVKTKNKDKYTLTNLVLFDTKEEDGRKLVVVNENKTVAKVLMKDRECFIDTIMRWLEMDYSEYKEIPKRIFSQEQVSQIELPEIPIIPQEVFDKIEKDLKKKRRVRKKKSS